MIPSLELIGRTVIMLTAMRDSGDYAKIDTAINHLDTAGNMLIDHMIKHDCKTCPSCGRGINENRH